MPCACHDPVVENDSQFLDCCRLSDSLEVHEPRHLTYHRSTANCKIICIRTSFFWVFLGLIDPISPIVFKIFVASNDWDHHVILNKG